MTDKTDHIQETQLTDKSDSHQGFEKAIGELEALTVRMAEGNLSLEESISMYKRGVELAQSCQKTLEAAEQQVKVLQGQLLGPLNPDDLRDNS